MCYIQCKNDDDDDDGGGGGKERRGRVISTPASYSKGLNSNIDPETGYSCFPQSMKMLVRVPYNRSRPIRLHPLQFIRRCIISDTNSAVK
jgi:hypothetical protein